jgi:ABC-type multidrug transport system fused ATPase/permease subunit
MLMAVLRASLSFYDTTPIGRIMNRFSRDIDTVDTVLPELMESWLTTAFNILATVIILCFATPKFVVVAVSLAVLYYFAQVELSHYNLNT